MTLPSVLYESTGSQAGLLNDYSLRPKISVVFASREITLTKYIVKNINIYNTELISWKDL